MNHIEQLKRELSQRKDQFDPDAFTTHLKEIAMLIRHGLDDLAIIDDMSYGFDQLNIMLRFVDKKRYSIEIREVRSGELK